MKSEVLSKLYKFVIIINGFNNRDINNDHFKSKFQFHSIPIPGIWNSRNSILKFFFSVCYLSVFLAEHLLYSYTNREHFNSLHKLVVNNQQEMKYND